MFIPFFWFGQFHESLYFDIRAHILRQPGIYLRLLSLKLRVSTDIKPIFQYIIKPNFMRYQHATLS